MINFKLSVAMANTGEIQKSYKLIDKLAEKTTMQNFEQIITPHINKLSEDKNNILLLNYAAFYELIKNDYNKAIKYFKKINRLEPENIWIQNYMASCYIEIEEYKTAENIIKESQKIQDSEFSHLLLGLINYKKGYYVGSVIEFSKSGELFGALLSEIK